MGYLKYLLLAACGSPAIPDAPHCAIDLPARGNLHLAGTRFVDDLGRTVFLRGVGAGARAKIPPYQPFDAPETVDTYLDRAASWGIDVLRVPFSWQAAEPTQGTQDEDYLARYDALLGGAWARGLWTIVDVHQDVYAEPYCGDGFPAWTLTDPPAPHHDCPSWFSEYDSDADVRAAFDALWSDPSLYRAELAKIVAREVARPGVIGLEPFNEPAPGTANRATWEAATLAPFYSDLAAQIAPTPLFVDTPGVEGVLGSTNLPRPDGADIVLAPHEYDPSALFGGSPSSDVIDRLQPWADLGVAWNVPVFVGEMGIPMSNPDAAVDARRHWAALDTLGISGSWWEYSVSPTLWNSEQFSIVNGDGSDTPVVTELARPYVRALAGHAATITFDRSLELRYTSDSDAPTEIAAPRAPVRIGAIGACVDDTHAGTVLVQATDADVQLSIE
jgi:endoglycosylceramidase